MASEKEFIETCKRLIEEKIKFPQNNSWKQRDFEYLSDLIVEKTGTRISISTLKRIWKDGGDRLPQVYTLNALAGFAGFESWSAFKQQHSDQPGTGATREVGVKQGFKIPKKSIYLLFIPVLLICLLLIFYFKPVRENYNENQVIFKSRKNLISGVPNTVVFEYDISKIDFDSAFIQHTWDKRLRARVSRDNHFQTFIYYYPGYHLAKLIVNNKILKTENINISTAGWQAIVDDIATDGLPQYVPGNIAFKKGQLYISKETLLKNRIDVGKEFWVHYFNVGDFKKAYGENFIVETRLKSSLEDEALTCQYCQLTIICEQGMISLPFCNPGCIANIDLHIGDVFKAGRKNDLSAFGIDLSKWRNIKIKTVNKLVEVYIDDRKVFQQSFNQALGRITGFHYKFYGCGAVDAVKLYNEKSELCFADDFDAEP